MQSLGRQTTYLQRYGRRSTFAPSNHIDVELVAYVAATCAKEVIESTWHRSDQLWGHSMWSILGGLSQDSTATYPLATMPLMWSSPRWSFEAVVRWSLHVRHGFPSTGLSLEQRIAPDSLSMANIILGLVRKRTSSIEMIRYLERYPQAVRDISYQSGGSALHYAIQRGHTSAIRILLAAGADSLHRNDYGFHAMTKMMFAKDTQSIKMRQELGNILPVTRLYKELDFPHLHRVVLKVLPLDLSTCIKNACLDDLNRADKMVWNALHWAASQGDSDAVG